MRGVFSGERRVTQTSDSQREHCSGYIAQFSSLSFFCFLFCMALDIFIKFKKMDPHTDHSLERQKV